MPTSCAWTALTPSTTMFPECHADPPFAEDRDPKTAESRAEDSGRRIPRFRETLQQLVHVKRCTRSTLSPLSSLLILSSLSDNVFRSPTWRAFSSPGGPPCSP